MVEIINSKDFFEMLQARGVRKNNNEHANLKNFLALDPNYTSMLMLKKVANALDEMAKNEELMAGILAAAEEDIAAAEGQIGEEDEEAEDGEGPNEQQRLITIGEDGEEENMRMDTRDKNKHK